MILAVGCPVAHRDWIMDRWFDHIEESCSIAGIDPFYVFVGDTTHDPTFKVIADRAERSALGHVPNARGWDRRDWSSPDRYDHMVLLRNKLLRMVRSLDVDAFLSIDSDILAHPQLVTMLTEDLNDGHDWAAVGSRCYMTTSGRQFPSWADLGRDGSLRRSDSECYSRVDVIMAIKLMSRAAYAIDYEVDPQGEDIGWSRACARAGLSLGWDGRVASKHVMAPHLLDVHDARVGY